jgi:hypothetical protein
MFKVLWYCDSKCSDSSGTNGEIRKVVLELQKKGK